MRRAKYHCAPYLLIRMSSVHTKSHMYFDRFIEIYMVCFFKQLHSFFHVIQFCSIKG